MKKRLPWLDVGKGLGMVLVMLGHSDIPDPIKTYIYTFHMPLFFFLSGYLFSIKKYPKVTGFLLKRLKTLILPYLCFSIVAYFWFLLVRHLGLVHYSHDLITPLIGSIVAIRKSDWTVHSGALWFVACLFCTELIFYLITKLGRSKKLIGCLLVFISAIGCFYNKTSGDPLPWSLDVAMISVGFYGAGFFFKEYQMKFNRFLNLSMLVPFILLNVVTGYLNFVQTGKRVDFYNSSLGNIGLFYLSAFAGIGAFIIIIKRMKSYQFLQFLGKNSLIYLALHQKIVFLLIDQLMGNSLLELGKMSEIPLLKGLFYTVATGVILVPIVYAINHYLPFVVGRSSKTTVKEQVLMKAS